VLALLNSDAAMRCSTISETDGQVDRELLDGISVYGMAQEIIEGIIAITVS